MFKNKTGEKVPKTFRQRLKIQLTVFFVLFILAEIVLRLFGMKAGTLMDDFKVEDNPVYVARFESDEMGINHIIPKKEMLIWGSVINKQGFRGKIDYTPEVMDSLRKSSSKQIIMLIGDSYVEGCCPDSVQNSFGDILNRDGRFNILNFGVAGTDPVQYELVVKKYLDNLKPDKVVICVYFGNDILSFVRTPTPGIPLHFPFRNNKWIFELAPNDLSGKLSYNFHSADEAYNFYVDHYTLKGKSRNLFEKLISYSVILSKVYLTGEHTLAKRRWQKSHPGYTVDANEIAYKNLKSIETVCKDQNIPCLFVGIPAPFESEEGDKLKTKYAIVFKDISWFVPTTITKKDYDGPNLGNHFNNAGHQKYADFLTKLLKEKNPGK